MPDEKNELQHNVFISWSGNRSQHVAHALRDWLPMVLQAAKPFMSKKDIDKGSRWHIELAKALEVMKVGIICLTPENLTAPWLLFESGALSKTVDRGTRVCTYLLAGLQPQEVPAPLGEFQATRAEKEDTLKMIQDMNKSLGSPVTESTLNGVFDALWAQLEAQLLALPEPESKVPPKRSVDDMVAEILDTTRALAKSSQSLQDEITRARDYARVVTTLKGKLSDMAKLGEMLTNEQLSAISIAEWLREVARHMSAERETEAEKGEEPPKDEELHHRPQTRTKKKPT